MTAADGEEALAAVRSHDGRIDLVITDVAMPRLDGGRLAGAIAELSPRTRILFTSGHAEKLAGLAENGRVEMLAKPFSIETLLAKVAEILRA